MNDEILAAFMSDPVNASALLQSSFKAFHELMMYHCYRINWDWQPFHYKIVNKLEQYAFGRNLKQNLVINMPPRFGKTALMESFEAWSFLLNPYSKIIHTSYSDTLIKQSSKNVKNMLMSPAFQKFSNYLPLRQDSQKAEEWKTEPVKGMIGGSYRAATLAGALTGFGFGVSGIDTWGGCCFTYDTLVSTENGLMKIGDIVENHKNIKVWSKDLNTGRYELQSIRHYVKNKDSSFVRVKLSDGNFIDCTPDHKFYVNGKGYIQAKNLSQYDSLVSFSNSFDLCESEIKKFHNFFACSSPVKNNSHFLVRKFIRLFRFIVNVIYKTFKRFAAFNSINSSLTDSILLCNDRHFPIVTSNSLHLFSSKFGSTENKSSTFNSVLHIFRFSSIAKIFKSIIRRIVVKMTTFHTSFLFSDECSKNKLVNANGKGLSFFAKVNIIISFIKRAFKDSFFPIFKTFYKSCIRYLIKSFKIRNVFVDDVVSLHNKDTSYCLDVWHNHNILVGKSQVLVSNCTIDDPVKASMNISRADIKACIDLYTGSLKSRANNPKAPFIMIMQRLDPDDLTGYVLENETDEWEQLKIPAYDEQTGESIWEDKMPSYKLEAMKKNSVSVYYGQYQQEPIVVGGEVFKSEWFQFYNPNEYYPYQAIYGVADTAMKKGEANDFTVLSLWGQTYTGTIHLLDMVRGKWDAVELVEVFKATWEKWQHRDIQPYGIYIEDKSSGIGLIQTLKTQTAIPFLPIQRTSYKTDDGILVRADKYSRALAVVPHIAAGRVLLPNNPTDEVSAMLLTEATAFRSDLRAKHDDCVDCLCDAVNIAFSPNFISSVYI